MIVVNSDFCSKLRGNPLTALEAQQSAYLKSNKMVLNLVTVVKFVRWIVSWNLVKRVREEMKALLGPEVTSTGEQSQPCFCCHHIPETCTAIEGS